MALAVLLIPFAAASAEMSRDFVEAGYVQGDVDLFNGASVDFDGFELRGSRAFGNWTMIGGYRSLSSDTFNFSYIDSHGGISSDMSWLKLGAGYTLEFSETCMLTFESGYLRESADVTLLVVDANPPGDGTPVTYDWSENSSDGGYFLGINLRMKLTERLEAEAGFERTRTEDGASNYRTSLRYHFNESFSASGDWQRFDGDNALGISGRYGF